MKSKLSEPHLSIVSPVYNGEGTLTTFVNELRSVLVEAEISFELILVHDCGVDNSWKVIESLVGKDPKIVGVNLSRNFGQHAAIRAGVEIAEGRYCLVVDSDLQHDPIYIPNMLKKVEMGTDIVIAVAENRKQTKFKNITAALFYFLINLLTDDLNSKGGKEELNYSLFSRKVMEIYCRIQHVSQHHLMTLRWIGLKREYFTVRHRARTHGKSNYSFRKLVRHAIGGIVMYSDKLLYLSVNMGILFLLFSFGLSVYLVYNFFVNNVLPGYTSIAVLILFSTSLTLFSIGVIGIYLGMTFRQVKNRPLYIIDKII